MGRATIQMASFLAECSPAWSGSAHRAGNLAAPGLTEDRERHQDASERRERHTEGGDAGRRRERHGAAGEKGDGEDPGKGGVTVLETVGGGPMGQTSAAWLSDPWTRRQQSEPYLSHPTTTVRE
jgi:hypothetical protein